MPNVPRGIILTERTPTVREALQVRERVTHYFGEGEWTDPEAFIYAVYIASMIPEVLEDEWFMRQLTRGGQGRW